MDGFQSANHHSEVSAATTQTWSPLAFLPVDIPKIVVVRRQKIVEGSTFRPFHYHDAPRDIFSLEQDGRVEFKGLNDIETSVEES